jgi:hypothetical protein
VDGVLVHCGHEVPKKVESKKFNVIITLGKTFLIRVVGPNENRILSHPVPLQEAEPTNS